MPVGVFTNKTDRFELKTLPEGYVVVRRMNYGESLVRQNMASKIYMEQGATSKDMRGEVDIQTVKIAHWDFANLVVEHNVTDENDRPLNFKNAADVNRLDGPVGDEIGKIIDDYNRPPETDEEVKN